MKELVHIHIPRTAGSSLNRILAPVCERAEISMKRGHNFWGDFEPAPGRVFFVTFREPIERVRSILSFIQSNPTHRAHQRLMAAGVDAYLDDHERAFDMIADGQTRQLNKRRAEGYRITTEHLFNAFAVIRRPDVIACCDSAISSGLARIGEKLGITLPEQAPRTNTSPPLHLSTRAIDRILELNPMDAMLYRIVQIRHSSTPSTSRVQSQVVGEYEPSVVYRA